MAIGRPACDRVLRWSIVQIEIFQMATTRTVTGLESLTERITFFHFTTSVVNDD